MRQAKLEIAYLNGSVSKHKVFFNKKVGHSI